MNVSYQNTEKGAGLLTISIVKADYQENFEKSLKKIRRDAQMPGFRKGMVPASIIRKVYAPSVEADEVNKLLGETLNKYLEENNIQILGEPLPNEGQQQIDFNTMDEYVFLFDLALRPELNVEVSDKDEVPYYDIQVSDEQVSQQIQELARRSGENKQFDTYQDKDMVKGKLVELDENGLEKEGGILVEDALTMPSFFKNEEQKALFEGAAKGSVVVFNPFKAYEGNEGELASLLKIGKEEAKEMKSDFSYQIGEISRFVPSEVNQNLFDAVYGKDVIASEEDFRARVKADIERSRQADSDYKFYLDARNLLMAKAGEMEVSETLLKRIMKANNPDKDDAFINDNYQASLETLKWQFILDKLAPQLGVTVGEADVKAAARSAVASQLAQYGLTGLPESTLDEYAKEMLKKKDTVENLIQQSLNEKVAAAIKGKVTLKHQDISFEDFNKMFEA